MASASDILIIEDETLLRRILKRKLEESGFAVREAEDGATGLREIENKHPDLLILDWLLPDIDGLEILRTIREKRDEGEETFPVVVLSNFGNENYRKQYEDMGACEYVIKSNIDVDDLPGTIERCMEEWKSMWKKV